MIANIIRSRQKTALGGGGGGGIVIDNGDPFYSAVSLLLPMDGTNGGTTFTDSGPNAIAVTASGNAQISTTQSKYGGASAYFDGAGDYLTTPANSIVFGSGDWTIEFWLYLNNSIGSNLIDQRSSGSQLAPSIYYNGSSIRYLTLGADRIIGSSLQLNQWHHIAVVKASSQTKMYLNGTQTGSTYSDSNNYIGPNFTIGAYQPLGNTPPNGYIDDLRISKFARYTSNFTPPTAALPTTASSTPADPYYGYTSLLLHMDGTNASTNFVDSGPSALAVTAVGNAQVSTTQSKYGGASAYFDGTGDYLSFTGGMPSGSGTAFTIECWIRLDDLNSYRAISRTGGGLDIGVQPSGMVVCDQTGVGIIANSATGVITAGTWYHIAVTRDTSNNYKIYVNGTQVASGTNSFSVTAATTIGFSAFSGAHYFKGYIDDFRATNVLRYTSNFTPPTQAHPNA